MPRPIRATISAGAFAQNLTIARRHAGAASLWAVLKANAYGHGLERAAGALGAAEGFAVLDFDEAARLRALGVQKPILLLEGFFEPGDVPMLHRHALTPVIHNAEQVEMLARAQADEAIPIDVYLKTEHRDEPPRLHGRRLAQGLPERCSGHRAVRSITLMTHFADADGPGGIAAQLAVFEAACKPLGRLPRSIANSAALLRYPEEARGDWVRPGIMLYGCTSVRRAQRSVARSAAGR